MSNRTVHAWLGTFAASSFMLVCNVITGILVARLLLPEGRGTLAAILFWPQLVAGLGLMSLNTAVTQQASRSPERARSITITGIYLAIALAILTIGITYSILPLLMGSDKSQWVPAARLYLLSFLPLNFVSAILIALRHAEQKFTSFNTLRLIPTITYLAGLLFLWLTDNVRIEAILWCNWIGTALVAVVQLGLVRSLFWQRPAWSDARSLLGMASRFKVASFAAMLAREGDRIVIMSVLSTTTIGLYAVAFTFATSGLKVLTSSFQSVLLPKIAQHADSHGQHQVLSKGLRYTMLLSITSSLGLAAIAPVAIPILFGTEFSGAVLPAIVLFAAYCPKVMRHVIAHSLYGLDQPRPITISAVIASVSFVILAFILVTIVDQPASLITILLSLLIANLAELAYLLHYLNCSIHLRIGDWWGLNWRTVNEVIDIFKAAIATRRPSLATDSHHD